MPEIHYILKDGTTRSVEARTGSSVMETAITANVRGIDGECGGCLSCATCHVYVESGGEGLPEPDEVELEMLEAVAAERRDNSRLSCQLVITADIAGLTLRVPECQG
jgi:2Fe-2S ferredoxin